MTRVTQGSKLTRRAVLAGAAAAAGAQVLPSVSGAYVGVDLASAPSRTVFTAFVVETSRDGYVWREVARIKGSDRGAM